MEDNEVWPLYESDIGFYEHLCESRLSEALEERTSVDRSTGELKTMRFPFFPIDTSRLLTTFKNKDHFNKYTRHVFNIIRLKNDEYADRSGAPHVDYMPSLTEFILREWNPSLESIKYSFIDEERGVSLGVIAACSFIFHQNYFLIHSRIPVDDLAARVAGAYATLQDAEKAIVADWEYLYKKIGGRLSLYVWTKALSKVIRIKEIDTKQDAVNSVSFEGSRIEFRISLIWEEVKDDPVYVRKLFEKVTCLVFGTSYGPCKIMILQALANSAVAYFDDSNLYMRDFSKDTPWLEEIRSLLFMLVYVDKDTIYEKRFRELFGIIGYSRDYSWADDFSVEKFLKGWPEAGAGIEMVRMPEFTAKEGDYGLASILYRYVRLGKINSRDGKIENEGMGYYDYHFVEHTRLAMFGASVHRKLSPSLTLYAFSLRTDIIPLHSAEGFVSFQEMFKAYFGDKFDPREVYPFPEVLAYLYTMESTHRRLKKQGITKGYFMCPVSEVLCHDDPEAFRSFAEFSAANQLARNRGERVTTFPKDLLRLLRPMLVEENILVKFDCDTFDYMVVEQWEDEEDEEEEEEEEVDI